MDQLRELDEASPCHIALNDDHGREALADERRDAEHSHVRHLVLADWLLNLFIFAK